MLALGYALAAIGTALVTALYVVRFLLAEDPLAAYLPSAQVVRDAHTFATFWPLYVLYALSASWAMFEGVRALRLAFSNGQAARRFAAAAALAAIAGLVLASARGPEVPGAATIAFYWWGLAALWLVAIAQIVIAARAGVVQVVRDWTAYSFGLALLPVTYLPSVPLWAALDAMTLDTAVITASTASFASHYLLAHLIVYEVVPRRLSHLQR